MTFKEYLKSLLHHRPHCPKLDYAIKQLGAAFGASLMLGTAIAIGLIIYFNDKITINVESLAQIIPLTIGAIWLYIYVAYCEKKMEEERTIESQRDSACKE